jgi:hypothetical protein
MYRAIRARTLDLLGRTDQSYYYQNNLNCSKNPTCILSHWALSMSMWIPLPLHWEHVGIARGTHATPPQVIF